MKSINQQTREALKSLNGVSRKPKVIMTGGDRISAKGVKKLIAPKKGEDPMAATNRYMKGRGFDCVDMSKKS